MIEIKVRLAVEHTEVLIAELYAKGFDSFAENEEGFDAYVEEKLFDEKDLNDFFAQYTLQIPLSYTIGKLEHKNWNAEWEKSFSPVVIAEKCLIRATFHEPGPAYPYEIIIDPKMAFGTGHHETTSMMVELQLSINHKDKNVLDAGSGTGILAIMASKLGAKHVDAYDIDEWAFENINENSILNDCSNIKSYQGDIKNIFLPLQEYDIILANINKNVLLQEIPVYSSYLKKNGLLALSGFYEDDIQDLEKVINLNALRITHRSSNNHWACVVAEKVI